jgi:hypothetical protein
VSVLAETPRPRGHVIIEWARPAGHALPGRATRILDAESGEMIPTVTRAVIVEVDALVVAALTQLTGPDGEPLPPGAAPHLANGEAATGIFRYWVAEMRVQAAP